MIQTKGLFFLVFLVYLNTSTKHSISTAQGKEGTLSNANNYKEEKCKILKHCKKCSFLEVKQIKECLISKFIKISKCARINAANKNDKFVYMLYDPCEPKDFFTKLDYSYIFVIFCSLCFIGFLIYLNKYKTFLEYKLYDKMNK